MSLIILCFWDNSLLVVKYLCHQAGGVYGDLSSLGEGSDVEGDDDEGAEASEGSDEF